MWKKRRVEHAMGSGYEGVDWKQGKKETKQSIYSSHIITSIDIVYSYQTL